MKTATASASSWVPHICWVAVCGGRAGASKIMLELIRAQDGSTLWSQRYERPYADLFVLQDEISASVVHALQSKTGAGARAAQLPEIVLRAVIWMRTMHFCRAVSTEHAAAKQTIARRLTTTHAGREDRPRLRECARRTVIGRHRLAGRF